MKKNSLALLTISLLILCFMAGCNLNKTDSTNISNNIVTRSDANFKDIKSNFNEIQDNSDAVVIGTVRKSYSYKLNNLIFTNYIVDLQRQIKNINNLPNEIEIRFTGGQVDNEIQPIFDEVKPLEINQTYLFALKKVFPDKPDNNFYAILGGEHQGILKVQVDDKKNITKLDKFNDKNKIEKSLLTKNIEDLLKKN